MDATKEWLELWAQSPANKAEWSWAHAFGRMRGRDQVWYGTVSRYTAMTFQTYLEAYDEYPEIGGKDPRPLMECSVHTLVNDVIEVAADGKSARASFITPGVIHSVLTPMGHRYCHILWERYGSDFVLEQDGWKYLHEHVCPDILTSLDKGDWAAEDYARLIADEGEATPPATLGEPPPVADPGPLHQPHSILRTPQNTCPWPEPYETMDNDNTYTPFLNDWHS
jgi:hypothetical protein